MRAHIEKSWMRDTVQVWLTEGSPKQLLRLGADGFPSWEPVPEAATLPAPTLELPADALEAIIAAGSDFLPPSGAQSKHLDDAVAVRDRLLTLVELSLPKAKPQAPLLADKESD